MPLSYGSRCIAIHLFRDNRSRSESKPPLDYPRLFAELPLEEMCAEAVPSIDSGRVVHVLWRTIIWPLDVSRELFMDGQSFSPHTVSGSLAVH